MVRAPDGGISPRHIGRASHPEGGHHLQLVRKVDEPIDVEGDVWMDGAAHGRPGDGDGHVVPRVDPQGGD